MKVATVGTKLDPADENQLEKGGLFSLDGIHPTTIGYGLLAHEVVRVMKDAGVDFAGDMNWTGIVRADKLVNRPPALLANLRDTLTFLDRRGLLSALFEQLA